jgi:hypothetical protein
MREVDRFKANPDLLPFLQRRRGANVPWHVIAAEVGELYGWEIKGSNLAQAYRRALDPETAPEPERVYEPKRRSCLSCGRGFKSEWPGHRVCGTCKRREVWQSGDDYAIPMEGR